MKKLYTISFGKSVYYKYGNDSEYSRKIRCLGKEKAQKVLDRINKFKWVDWTDVSAI